MRTMRLTSLETKPSGKLPFDCQKIAKNLTFFSKKLTKIVIFSNKIANGNFVEKNDNFVKFKFFEKMSFWQFSRGSAQDTGLVHSSC